MDKEFSLILLGKKLQISRRIACSAAQINYSVRDPEVKLSPFSLLLIMKSTLIYFSEERERGKKEKL